MSRPVNPAGPSKVYSWLSPLLPTLLPPVCTLCEAPGLPGLDLCRGCHDDLPWNRHACLRCALPLPAATQMPALCGGCLKAGKSIAYDLTWAAFIYRQPLPWLISQLKFHSRLQHARLLADLMWQSLEAPLRHQPHAAPSLIIPIPLHRQRLRERGFNQAMELARRLSRRSGIPLDTRCLTRKKHTQRQSDLSKTERRKNLRDAFACRTVITARHVVLIDDVMTSGNTLNAAAMTLKSAGAEKVSIWVAARAARHAI